MKKKGGTGMSKTIVINTGRLNLDKESEVNLLNRINRTISEMQKSVSQLNQMWDGSVKQSFREVFMEDIQALQVICENFQKLIQYETFAVDQYTKAEQQTAELLGQIKV